MVYSYGWNVFIVIAWKLSHLSPSPVPTFFEDDSLTSFCHCSRKNMETIYWTCGGVANMVNIIIVRFQIIILQTWLQV